MRVTGVSYSSDKKLVRCEQQYSYRYDEKLKRRIKGEGLFRGDWLHQLLEAYRKREKWEKTFARLHDDVWGRLFDEEKEMYGEDFPDVIHDLFEHYVDHWGADDALLRPVCVEQAFELVTKSGLLIRFKADYIATDGKVNILFENKNKKKIPEAEERILDRQVNGYVYLLSKLPKPIRIDKIVWDYIRTTPVPRPKILKKGGLSERQINTDQRGYLLSLKEAGIHPQTEDERLGLENTLKSLPLTLTLERVTNKPNLRVGELVVRDWVERAKRAQEIKRPTRNWNSDCKWDCDYMTLCMADMLGKPDRETIIKHDFVTSIKPAEEIKELLEK